MHILMRFLFNLRHVRETNGGGKPVLLWLLMSGPVLPLMNCAVSFRSGKTG